MKNNNKALNLDITGINEPKNNIDFNDFIKEARIRNSFDYNNESIKRIDDVKILIWDLYIFDQNKGDSLKNELIENINNKLNNLTKSEQEKIAIDFFDITINSNTNLTDYSEEFKLGLLFHNTYFGMKLKELVEPLLKSYNLNQK